MPKQTFFNLPEEKRRRIADLAVEEFADRPYGEASISRIVARAGIAKGSFYQYFEDKLDLYQWVLFSHVGQLKRAYIESHPPPAEQDIFAQLAHMLMMGLKFGLENPVLARLGARVSHTTDDQQLRQIMKTQTRVGHAVIRQMFVMGQAAGQVRPDLDLDMTADFVLSMLQRGLDLSMERVLGVDLVEFCTRPELAERMPPAAQRSLIDGVIDLLRRGLGTGHSGDAITLKFDYDEIMDAAQRDGT